MKITQIKQQIKKETRVSVFLDDKYSFSLTLDQLLVEKLKKGEEIDDARLESLKKLSDEGKLRARALEWVMGRPHSTRELRDYLYRKKASPDHITALIDEFTAKNYLNDENFARWFADIRLRKSKSTRAIAAELASKGVSTETIQNTVATLETKDDDALVKLVSKLSTRSRYQDPIKLTRYLMGKGFNYRDITDAIKNNADFTP